MATLALAVPSALGQRQSALVLFLFSRFNAAMPLLTPCPERVPFDEVADVLARAARRVPGGPPALVDASGRHLAGALAAAGYAVVRDGLAHQGDTDPQLSL